MDKRQERLLAVQSVLWKTLFLNLVVCAVKIALGLATGVLAIIADGVHTLGDSMSNVIGIFAIRLSRREPDERYPYGYDKFEAIATLIIASVIAVTFFEVTKEGILRLLDPQPTEIHPLAFLAMLVAAAVNVVIVRYEGGAGRRLSSELLIADAAETKSDLYVSLGVILAVGVMSLGGFWWFDGVITLVIGGFILKVIVDIIRSTVRVLCDGNVVDPAKIERIVRSVPGVRFCHAIRSRGREAGFYADFHLGVDPTMSVEEAHDQVSHHVKRALHDAFPNLKAATIHIEPDNESGRGRRNSVFRRRDPYGT